MKIIVDLINYFKFVINRYSYKYFKIYIRFRNIIIFKVYVFLYKKLFIDYYIKIIKFNFMIFLRDYFFRIYKIIIILKI